MGLDKVEGKCPGLKEESRPVGKDRGRRRVDGCDGYLTRGCLGNHRESYTSVQLVCANSFDKKNKLKTVKLSIIIFFLT